MCRHESISLERVRRGIVDVVEVRSSEMYSPLSSAVVYFVEQRFIAYANYGISYEIDKQIS